MKSFRPSNPQKYLGDPSKINYETSLQLTMMLRLDRSESILGWLSEGLPTEPKGIPYQHPITGQRAYYMPDFFVISMNKKNKKTMQVIAIKPLDEVPLIGNLNEAQLLNAARFAAAVQYCAARGWQFRVGTGE
jgi:hypothetical protein